MSLSHCCMLYLFQGLSAAIMSGLKADPRHRATPEELFFAMGARGLEVNDATWDQVAAGLNPRLQAYMVQHVVMSLRPSRAGTAVCCMQ